jgi:hypothetical protein
VKPRLRRLAVGPRDDVRILDASQASRIVDDARIRSFCRSAGVRSRKQALLRHLLPLFADSLRRSEDARYPPGVIDSPSVQTGVPVLHAQVATDGREGSDIYCASTENVDRSRARASAEAEAIQTTDVARGGFGAGVDGGRLRDSP